MHKRNYWILIYLFDSCRVSVTCLDKNDVISAVGAVGTS
jgi:hypothetical protein